MSTVAILGAGVMGSAMSFPVCDRGHRVRLIGTHLDGAIIDSLQASGTHPKLNTALPEGVESFDHKDIGEALRDADIVILGVSSVGAGWAIDGLSENLKAPAPVVMLTKGLYAEPARLTALPERVKAEVKRRTGMVLEIAGVGGPCIAAELAARHHTGTVIAAHDFDLAKRLCAMLETSYYHPRPTTDVIGVEACAAFKNFFAIAVGWAGKNHNAAANIFNQAIIEMMTIARTLGGEDASVWGMAGAGDLYVTCLAGRNSRLGGHLGQGLTYRQAINGPMRGETIEGADLGLATAMTLQAMMTEGKFARGALPLTQALLAALTEDKPLELQWADFHR
ncbi:MAG: glycerol-3-phosphate dehydrogenase [Rhizobiales bacterium]|nr:glycerol-3-phosphate dehydrogenase [Hyphomicrobiales bacterium]